MKIHLSAATTADGALDDRSAGRLRISTDADWAAVQRLRAQCDAILVGAETVRRDNPRLTIADTVLRTERSKEGRGPDPAKVTVTRTGCLDPASRFFTCGEGRKIVSEMARIHYILQEGTAQEDQTLVLVNLLTRSRKKDEILEELRGRIHVTAPFTILSDSSLYNRRTRQENSFCPVRQPETGELQMDDFVPKPLYTGRELEEFKAKNSQNGTFSVSEETVSSIEDLEKLLLVWQEAPSDRTLTGAFLRDRGDRWCMVVVSSCREMLG